VTMAFLRRSKVQIAENPQEIVSEADAKIKAHIYRRRVTVDEFFCDFDRLNRGVITPTQFERGLGRIGVQLHAKEVAELSKAYETTHRNEKVIKWRDFVDEMNTVFAPRLSNHSPDFEVVDAQAFIKQHDEMKRTRMMAVKGKRITDAQRQKLQQTVDMLREEALRTRVMIKDYLKDHDKLNRGYITIEQFRRTLSNIGWNIQDDVMELLEFKYCSPSHPEDICYRKFLEEVDPSPEQVEAKNLSNQLAGILAGKRPKFQKTFQIKKAPIPDYNSLMKLMQTEMLRRRVQSDDMFLDFDKLRKGEVRISRFQAVLNSALGLSLRPEEVKILHNKYAGEDADMIQYRPFVRDLHSMYTQSGLEKAPTQQVGEFKMFLPDEQDGLSDDAERKECDAILERLRTQVRHQGLLYKPFLQAHDKCHKGVIAPNRLASVMHTLGLSLTQRELGLISKRFRKGDEIRYIPLCQHLDKPIEA